jgi:hypothetical protein
MQLRVPLRVPRIGRSLERGDRLGSLDCRRQRFIQLRWFRLGFWFGFWLWLGLWLWFWFWFWLWLGLWFWLWFWLCLC